MVDWVIKQTTSSSFLLLSEEDLVKSHSSLIGEVGWGCSLKYEEEVEKKEKIKFIEYNRWYIYYARENRKTSTKVERIFWNIVKNRKLFWYKFRRQKVIWPFILDFYCSELLLWIELDGWYHNETIEYDLCRDAEIYKKWILVIRFTNDEIQNNLSCVISQLEKIIKEKLKELLL